ncbi:MAG: transglycosylase SLT domain-containing protein [archaeon]
MKAQIAIGKMIGIVLGILVVVVFAFVLTHSDGAYAAVDNLIPNWGSGGGGGGNVVIIDSDKGSASSGSVFDMVQYVQANGIRNSANELKTCKEDYSKWIEQYAAEENINPTLILALMMQESDCQQATESEAEGDKKSWGVIQINKETYDDICKGVGSGFEDIKASAEKSVQCGIKILKKKYDLYGAYGKQDYYQGKVESKCNDPQYLPKYLTYTGWDAALRGYNGLGCIPPLADTDYVEKINAIKTALESVQNAER